MRTKVDFFSLESIELVELDLEPVLELSWMLKRRIRSGFLIIFTFFCVFGSFFDF